MSDLELKILMIQTIEQALKELGVDYEIEGSLDLDGTDYFILKQKDDDGNWVTRKIKIIEVR